MIVEDSIPLADGPGREKLCATHMLLSLAVLVMTVCYVVYFNRTRRRLYELRHRAAHLEQRVREEAREEAAHVL